MLLQSNSESTPMDRTHIKSIHEGQKFPCPQCEYKATKHENLQRHIKSIHDGKSFHAHNFTTKEFRKQIFRDT